MLHFGIYICFLMGGILSIFNKSVQLFQVFKCRNSNAAKNN